MQSYNAIIARFSNEAAYKAIEQVLEREPIAFCATITSKQHHYSQLADDKQPWFSSSDVRGCIYEGVDWNTIAPLDESVVCEMRECESMYMHMVSRIEKSRNVPYKERRRTYLKHLRFWNDFIEKHNINLFVSAWMPHEVPDHIIHFLCRKKGIPIILFHATPFVNCENVIRDWEKSTEQVGKRFAELQKEYEGKAIEEIPLGEQFEEYFKAQSLQDGKPAYTWPNDATQLTLFLRRVRKDPIGSFVSMMRYLSSFLSPRAWFRRAQKCFGERYSQKLHRFYCAHAQAPDLSAKFIYVPLQVQPECSTCPMAGAFMDQELILQMLSSALPDDVYLYVKEHPKQRTWSHACRSINYYQDLLDIKNVKLMSPETSTFDLREHCIAIATGTGTAGFEGLFRGKPALMFGRRFYQFAPGVFSIRSLADCTSALKTILAGEARPTLRDARLFMKAAEDTVIWTALSVHHQRITKLSTQEIADNTCEAIVKAIHNSD